MNPIDRSLREMLEERGESVHVVGNLADRAIERDRANRRRQVTGAALGAGLVLAVAVPIGWSAMGTTDRQIPVGPSQSTTVPTPPASTPSRAATSAPAPTSIPTITADGASALANLRTATGEVTGGTAIAYQIDNVIHNGTQTIELPGKAQAGRLARLAGGGWLVAGDQTFKVLVLDGDGKTLVELNGRPVVADDGTLFALSDLDGNLHAYDSRGKRLGDLDASTCACPVEGAGAAGNPGYEAVGIIGATVYATRGFTGDSVAWDVDTGRTRPIDGFLALVNARQRTALVTPDPNAASRSYCQELRELDTGETRWRLCGPIIFRSFSSDGSHLLGSGIIDGLDHSQLNPDGTFRYGGLVVVRTEDAAIVLEGRGDSTTGAGSPVDYRMGADGSITVEVGGVTGQRNLQVCSLDGACELVAPDRPRLYPDIPGTVDPYFLSDN